MKGLFKRQGEGKTFEASDHWSVFLCVLDFRILEGQTGGGQMGNTQLRLQIPVYIKRKCVCLYIYTYTRACVCLSVEITDTES